MKEENKKRLIKLSLTVVAVGVLVLAVYLLMKKLGIDNLTQEQLQEIIKKQGAKAPIAFIIVTFLQVTLVPIPGAVTILAGNYLFGTATSFLYSYVGMLLGSIVSFGLGRIIGRPFVNWLAGGKEKVDEWLSKIRGKEGVVMFFMFFFPFFPDDILCAIAGLLPFSWGGFLAMQIVTRATSIFGTLFFMSGQIIPWHGWGIVVLGVVAIAFIGLFIVCFINAEKLDNWFSSLFRKTYYGESSFLLAKKGQKPGKRISVRGKFIDGGWMFRVGGLYSCEEGFVVDLYSYCKKSEHHFDGLLKVKLVKQNKVIECEKIFWREYNPKKQKGMAKKESNKFMTHYKLENKRKVLFARLLFSLPDNEVRKEDKFYLLVSYKKGEEWVSEKVDIMPKRKSKNLKELKDEIFVK